MALDDVVPSTAADDARFEEATHRTTRWIDRCIAAHSRPAEQNLFAIVQVGVGGADGGGGSAAEVAGQLSEVGRRCVAHPTQRPALAAPLACRAGWMSGCGRSASRAWWRETRPGTPSAGWLAARTSARLSSELRGPTAGACTRIGKRGIPCMLLWRQQCRRTCLHACFARTAYWPPAVNPGRPAGLFPNAPRGCLRASLGM